METAQQPRFLMRDIWYNYGDTVPAAAKADLVEWNRRNRLDYSLTGTVGHAYRHIVPLKDDQLFREQPELFPHEDGRPVQKGQMAMGHPAVEERALRYVFDFFEQSPSAQMVSMSPNDWFGPWRSEATRHDNFTDAAVDLANRTARALKENPRTSEKKVGFYAYLTPASRRPCRVEDNVIVFVATRLNPLPWRWLVSLWSKKAENLGIRDYASILPWHGTRPTWGLTSLRRKVEFWDRNDIIGVCVESGNDWGGWGLYHYVMGRLLWNPRENVDRIFEDFTRKGFGKAAPEMGRYFKRWKMGYSAKASSWPPGTLPPRSAGPVAEGTAAHRAVRAVPAPPAPARAPAVRREARRRPRADSSRAGGVRLAPGPDQHGPLPGADQALRRPAGETAVSTVRHGVRLLEKRGAFHGEEAQRLLREDLKRSYE